jgi:Homing endonuclease associated repeat
MSDGMHVLACLSAPARQKGHGQECPLGVGLLSMAMCHKNLRVISQGTPGCGWPLRERIVTKEEVIAAINECAAKLGHAPSSTELRKHANVGKYDIRKLFGTHVKALDACGMEARGAGYEVKLKTLFLGWAEVVRELGKAPTMEEYDKRSKNSVRPLIRHAGSWTRVPLIMMEFANKEGLGGEFEDVLDIIATHYQLAKARNKTSGPTKSMTLRPRIRVGEPMYGEPLLDSPLTCAPINEMGVVFLFGGVARQLGFAVNRIQTESPDCEALRRVERDRWQRVRIEFEYESRNFLFHGHALTQCDLIICWSHNWVDCPLEVLELKSLVGRLDLGMEQKVVLPEAKDEHL